ncbi:MAG: hypothetical protein FWD78_10970 [Treponema sp.]|nr:hypothetical protein [Treponema sp.]
MRGNFQSATESWLSLGFEYGNFFESIPTIAGTEKLYTVSPGIDLNAYTFWNNKNIGLFVHDIFAFPQNITLEINGQKASVDFSSYDFINMYRNDTIFGKP